jgi:hypothetical protein
MPTSAVEREVVGVEKLIHETSGGQVFFILFVKCVFSGATSLNKTFQSSFIEMKLFLPAYISQNLK